MRPWLLLLAALSIGALAQPSLASGAKEGKKAEGAKAPKKQRPITSLESWVAVEPFSVTVVQEDRIRGKVLVSFGMDVPDAELREKAELVMPRLQDAWLSQLNLYAATTVRPFKPANITEVSNILQTVADRVLGKPGSKVLIASVIINMQ
jgi:flagellar basal body-associated protein FliL